MSARPFRSLGAACGIVAVVAVVAVGSASGARSRPAADPGVTGNSILVGIDSASTGPVAPTCSVQTQALVKDLAAVNKKGGVNGRKIRAIVLDNGNDPQRGVADVDELINKRGVFALLGSCGTGPIIASMPETQAAGVPLLFPSSPSDVVQRPAKKGVYTITPAFDQQTATIIPWAMSQLGKGSVSIVYLNGFSQYIIPAARWAAAQSGGSIAGEIAVSTSQTDFGSVVIQLRQQNPDYTLCVCTTPQGGLLLQAMKQQGYKPQKGFLCVYSCADNAFLASAGDAVGWSPVYLVNPVAPPSDPAVAKNCVPLAGIAPTLVSVLACAYTQMFVRALKDAGKNPTRASFQAALERFKNVQIGVAPRLTYRPGGLMNRGLYIQTIKNGTFVNFRQKLFPIPNDTHWGVPH